MIFRAKILEYKFIKSLNSLESCDDQESFNFNEHIPNQKRGFEEELIKKLDDLGSKLPSREFKNYLKEKWSCSLSIIREKIQNGTYFSIPEVKLNLAVLLCNMSINLSPDSCDDRL